VIYLYDSIIIGAGPVGSYLADKLARLGHKVLVLDKKSAPGKDVCCTGIISTDCFALLPHNLNLPRKTVRSATFVAPSGKSLRLSRREAVAYVVDRVALEQELVSHARSAGVHYIFNAEVAEVKPEARHVIVTSNCKGRKTEFIGETAVITTGFGSTLPAMLGLGEIKSCVIGAQAEVEISNADDVEIYFDRRLGPGGFSWLVRIGNNKGLVGQLSYRQPKQYFRKLLAALEKQGKISSPGAVPDFRLIPLKSLPRTYSDRLLVVGEAAGQVKPVTGGGLYYGFICSDIAADTLHRAFLAGDFSQSQLSSYQKQWHKMLGKEVTFGFWAHRFYRRLGNRQIESLYNLISRDGMPQFIAGLDEFPFDWHRRLIFKTLGHLALSLPDLVLSPLVKRKAGK
jgi:geranylgeranyl reductase family protein